MNDTKRFEWFFGPADKYEFLTTYLKGVGEGWTVEQWRAAIDQEMAKSEN